MSTEGGSFLSPQKIRLQVSGLFGEVRSLLSLVQSPLAFPIFAAISGCAGQKEQMVSRLSALSVFIAGGYLAAAWIFLVWCSSDKVLVDCIILNN